jgi:hypothetical protein
MTPQAQREDVHRRWMAAMLEGDLEAAWRQTDRLEIPRRKGNAEHTPTCYLRWNGTPLRGHHVLVRCLHGLGDTIQFARFLPEVKRIAASVLTMTQPVLTSLFQATPALGPVVNGWTAESPPHTVEVEIMELAYVFRSTRETLPRPPYFDLKTIRSLRPFRQLPESSSSLRVGLVWASSSWNPHRSIPLEELAGLKDIPGLELYSLQPDGTDTERDSWPFNINSLSLHTGEILDAAGAMLKLDLVITVDTLAAHLAGALDRPTWLLLQNEADWRWEKAGGTTPWYPSMRIFRQASSGDWSSVGRQVVTALKNHQENRALTLPTISQA